MWCIVGSILIVAVAGLALSGFGNQPFPTFNDITARAGITFVNQNSPTSDKYLIEAMTGGVAFIDYDADGWPDIFLVNGAALHAGQTDTEPIAKTQPAYWNRLYHNNRNGTFSDVTEKMGMKSNMAPTTICSFHSTSVAVEPTAPIARW